MQEYNPIDEIKEIICAYLGIGMPSSEIVQEIEEMYGIEPTYGRELVELCVDFLRDGNKE